MRPRMRTFHRGAPSWPRVVNHLDGRTCPTCKGSVHGPEAQEDHQQHHLTEAEFAERVNEWTEYVAKLGRQVAELCRLLNVTPLEDIGPAAQEDSASQWQYATQIVGGQYIPAGDPVE